MPDNFSFYLFLKGVKHGFDCGDLRISEPLSELDLAMQYAIGKEQTRRGTTEISLSSEDLASLIREHCGEEVYTRVFSDDPPELSDKALSDMLRDTVETIRKHCPQTQEAEKE